MESCISASAESRTCHNSSCVCKSTATVRVCCSEYRLVLQGAVVLVAIFASLTGFPRYAFATQFLDDFEGNGEVSQLPAAALHNWNIITSVDLNTETLVPNFCHQSGTCIDLVGTAGAQTGGITSKQTWPVGDYIIGFYLYGSGRNAVGGAVASGGTVSRIQVSFGSKSIYANSHIASDLQKFVVLYVRGSGKLKFLGAGSVANIGPLLDNVFILHARR